MIDIEIDLPGEVIDGVFLFDLPLDPEIGEAFYGTPYEASAFQTNHNRNRVGRRKACTETFIASQLEVPVCGWWNQSTDDTGDGVFGSWVTEGCQPHGRFPIRRLETAEDGADFALQCRCLHLVSEFLAASLLGWISVLPG